MTVCQDLYPGARNSFFYFKLEPGNKYQALADLAEGKSLVTLEPKTVM